MTIADYLTNLLKHLRGQTAANSPEARFETSGADFIKVSLTINSNSLSLGTYKHLEDRIKEYLVTYQNKNPTPESSDHAKELALAGYMLDILNNRIKTADDRFQVPTIYKSGEYGDLKININITESDIAKTNEKGLAASMVMAIQESLNAIDPDLNPSVFYTSVENLLQLAKTRFNELNQPSLNLESPPTPEDDNQR